MSKLMTNLKIAWTYFNGWRKKYWFTRTLVILLLFSPLLYERCRGHLIICDLVRIACDAILADTVPQYENALCKYYKILEIKRLQITIVVFADKNQNGILDADEIEFLKSKGCDTEEIQESVTKANMDKLAENAGKLGLLPPAYSTTQIRKNAFYAAHSETEFELKPLIDEVYDLIDRMNCFFPKFTEKQMNELNTSFAEEFTQKPFVIDFYSWPTWRNGLLSFICEFTSILGPLIATALWFSISMMIGLFFAIIFKRYKKFMSIIASLLFLFLLLYLRHNIPRSLSNNSILYHIFALAIFSIVAGLSGFKISRHIKDKVKWRILTVLIIGFLIILWSFNLDFMLSDLYPFCWGIGCLIYPISPTQINSFSWNLIIFATILILISVAFLYRYYRSEILMATSCQQFDL